VPQHAQKVSPPRTLNVPFILGRPLGAPDDSGLQHRVLNAALALLDRNDGPVSEIFDEDVAMAPQNEEPWVCPVTFAQDETTGSLPEKVLAEIALLQPWYDKGKSARAGATSVGLSGMDVTSIVNYLGRFITEDIPAEENAGEQLKHAAEDLKAFYNEAATSQPGNSTARELENWYWQDSVAGKLIREVRQACGESDNGMIKLTASFLLVPETQR
jgi:hypothetical protein